MRRTELQDPQAEKDAEQLLKYLPDIPQPVARPVLVVVSGLPGSGKSYFSRCLIHEIPLTVLETDVLRKGLVGQPTYSGSESARLYKACHHLIFILLKRGIPILFDATNLVESHREHLYYISDRLGIKLILVYVKAPPEIVYERLQHRESGLDIQGHSEAGQEVYDKMRSNVEPIRRNHFVVDTFKDIRPALEKVVREIRRCMRTSK